MISANAAGFQTRLRIWLFVITFVLPVPSFAAVTISAEATQNMSCSGGVCSPTATKALLNVNDLENLLASGSVKVTTTGTGVQANDIRVDTPVTWTTTSALTLDAYRSNTIGKLVSVIGTGGLTLATNDGGSGGTLSFGKKGKVQFANLSSALSINGTSYTLVNTVAALASAIASNPAGAYALANDYDAEADGTYKNAPILTTLTGAFEGLGNIVSNLSIHFEGHRNIAALFAAVGSTGVVNDVHLAHEHLHVLRGSAAGLVGINQGFMSGDSVSAVFEAMHCCFIGGLVAENQGTITASSATVSISTVADAGGLVGDNQGTITLSSAHGVITSTESPNFIVGGFVNFNRNLIDQSFADVAVTGADSSTVGGLVGEDEASITNSYATGAVTGGNSAEVGGLMGYGGGAVSSYSTGLVSGGSNSIVGGFLGVSIAGMTNSYWDTTTSGTNQGVGSGKNTGLTGLTTQQFQAGLPPGFKKSIWAENPNVNNGLPYLKANPPTQ